MYCFSIIFDLFVCGFLFACFVSFCFCSSLSFLKIAILNIVGQISDFHVFGFAYWKIFEIFWWCHIFLILHIPWNVELLFYLLRSCHLLQSLLAAFRWEILFVGSAFIWGFLWLCMDTAAPCSLPPLVTELLIFGVFSWFHSSPRWLLETSVFFCWRWH